MRLLLPLLLLLSLACGSATPEASPEGKVARAIELGKLVLADPDQAEAALIAAGSSADELEALLVEIAADEDMSELYAGAFAP